MNRRWSFLIGAMLALLLVGLMAVPARAADEQFTLAEVVPNDVFVFATTCHNPERAFLRDYWGEVYEALAQSGIGDDVLELISSLLGADQKAEFDRLRTRASQLLDGVDWEQMAGGEFAFAERFGWPLTIPGGGRVMGPPDILILLRGDEAGIAHNYDGLVAILKAMVEEIDKAAGYEALTVWCGKCEVTGADVASVNLLAQVPGAPSLPISVAKRGNILTIAMGEKMLAEVLELQAGKSSKKALADQPRFRKAFAKLPPAEDALEFFDMQAMLKPIGSLMQLASEELGSSGDTIVNVERTAEASVLIGKAIAAYAKKDIETALEFTEKAYKIAPTDSIVLYNLACFNALLGNEKEALGWLEKAVEGGFYAPTKIKHDADLIGLHDEPRYQAAVARAGELAAQHVAADVVINSVKKGEVYSLTQQAWQAYKKQGAKKQKDYEQCLRLVEQAYELSPTDSRVLFYLSCFHALLDHEDEALGFLERAVEGGFYCPQHIAKDPDLESIRGHARYKAALTKAREKAASLGKKKGNTEGELLIGVSKRLLNAVGVLDYIATVRSTDGYSVHTESRAALVPGAKKSPIYPVFGKQKQLTQFDRFLPRETVSFSVSSGIDIGELYAFLEDTARDSGPMGEELLAKWAAIQKQLGVNVQKDILDWIGDSMVTVTLEDGAGSVWLIEVDDEQVAREKVGAAVEFLSTKLTELMGTYPQLMMLSAQTSPTEHEQLEGFENLQFAMSPQPIVWGVTDDYLVFGSSANAAALCLQTARGAHPNIRENPRVMSETLVPKGPFTSVNLNDQRQLGEKLSQGVGIVSMIGSMAAMAIPNPEIQPIITKLTGILGKLAPVVRKIDFFKSTSTLTSFDGQAWHTRMVTHYFAPEERGGTAEAR